MKITPIDITDHHFARKMRGFDPEEVRSFLNLVASEFESLVVENNSLREKLSRAESSVSDLKEREKILKDTLLTAQKLAGDMRDEAQKEARLIIKEAEMKGGELLDRAARKDSELEGVIQNLRMERDAFEQRVRSSAEQHLRLLDLRKSEEEIDDRLRFMKKPQSGDNA
jgi:cell division initiation protein